MLNQIHTWNSIIKLCIFKILFEYPPDIILHEVKAYVLAFNRLSHCHFYLSYIKFYLYVIYFPYFRIAMRDTKHIVTFASSRH